MKNESKNIIKKIIWIITCLFIAVIGIFIALFLNFQFFGTDSSYVCTDIRGYNSKEHPIYSPLFLQELPSNLDVVTFVHYDYYHEEQDIYLEVKFETTEDMEKYISLLKKQCESSINPSATIEPPPFGWIVEETNPHNDKYTDWIFIWEAYSISSHEYQTGYEISIEECGVHLDSRFATISYSYEDLTVIQSHTSGTFCAENEYIPMYFIRFGVPTSKEHERVWKWPENDVNRYIFVE